MFLLLNVYDEGYICITAIHSFAGDTQAKIINNINIKNNIVALLSSSAVYTYASASNFIVTLYFGSWLTEGSVGIMKTYRIYNKN